MKSWLFSVALLAAVLATGCAPPSVTISWNPVSSSTAVLTGYKVYRAPCLVPLPAPGPGTCISEGAFAQVGGTSSTVTTYTDTTVSSGQSYSLYVTATYGPQAEESPASNHVGVAIP